MHLKEELEQRNLLYQFTDEKLFELLNRGGQKFYIGYDPSADSLQIGNMFSVMAAIHLMRYGNTCYFLVGGATGMIGDPSGKNEERNFLSEEQLRHNEQCIYHQLTTFLENIRKTYDISFSYEMVDNYDFYKDMNYLRFLGEVGKYITVNTMIAKESVKKRIEDPDKSITYAEFSYMLIQGYDFVHLFDTHGVNIQLGGSDQWGNVTTGMEIIRKKYDKEAFCLTIPLVTDASGKKYGKSEGNAVWVDQKKNSPYFVYQFFMNSEDFLVEKLLKVFSLKSLEEIDEIVKKHMEHPELRYGQRELASRVVEVLFWKEAVVQAQKITEILFGSEDKLKIIAEMNEEEKQALAQETGSVNLPGEEARILELAVESGLAPSNGEAKKLIQSGSLFFNEQKVEEGNLTIKKSDLINGVWLLRKGKKFYRTLLC